jgi:hypothetical protein
MSSKTKIQRNQEERIKQAIVRGHRNGICDKDGNSLLGHGDVLIPKPSNLGPSARTYVYRNGKMVEK